MCPLQLYLLSQWSMSTQPLSYRIFLNSKFQEHILWWTDIHKIRQGKILHLPTETETLCTDSSRTGWGASLNAVHLVHGEWDQETLSKRSINWLELKAIDLALDHFLPMLAHKSVMIHTDNTVCIYNLKKEGGTHSPDLCYIAWDILTKCQSHHIHHIHSCPTSDGDDERSSGQVEQSEQGHSQWCIDNSVFRAVTNQLGEPGIDLFATCLNKKLPVYVSPCPDPQALAIDALSMDWNNLPLAYGFPPMPILPKGFRKSGPHQPPSF